MRKPTTRRIDLRCPLLGSMSLQHRHRGFLSVLRRSAQGRQALRVRLVHLGHSGGGGGSDVSRNRKNRWVGLAIYVVHLRDLEGIPSINQPKINQYQHISLKKVTEFG